MESMNLFSDENIKFPKLKENPTDFDLLNFIVLTIIQEFNQENLVFKGGYVLNHLMPNTSRMTRDVDLSVDSKENYDKIKKILKALGDYFINNGIIDSYNVKDDIQTTMSGGINFYDEAGRKIFGVDASLHQLVLGTKWYDFNGITLHAFTIERILGDKIHVVFSTKRLRRVKDLYDIYYLLENFNIDYSKLKENVDNRGALDLDENPFREGVLVQYEYAWNKLRVLSFNGDKILEKPKFVDVINRLGEFCIVFLNPDITKSIWIGSDCKWR